MSNSCKSDALSALFSASWVTSFQDSLVRLNSYKGGMVFMNPSTVSTSHIQVYFGLEGRELNTLCMKQFSPIRSEQSALLI